MSLRHPVTRCSAHTRTSSNVLPVKNFESTYGMASISRLLKITGLFCKRALQKRLYPAKETYNFREPTLNVVNRNANLNSE